MVFVLSGAAALFLGVGWVVQQRVATHSTSGGLLSWTVLMELVSSGLWWLGIVAMTIGQTSSSVALQFGPVSTVEPVLVASLLVAFVISAVSSDHSPRWQEMAGPTILIAALVVFLTVASPRQGEQPDPSWQAILIAAAAAGVFALLVAGSGKLLASRTAPVVECTLLAVGAGVMYGLQDAATRGAIVFSHHHELIALIPTMWPWVLLASATAGVLLTQASFRAGRLDWALPPTAASQPIAGIVIGVVLLGDHLAATGLALAFESLSLVAMLGGVLLIGQSRAFGT
ncbi:MAG TPA: DMT family transporter [Acidothermaceae bacterium]|nr:DMT family transporter [Acidothermaceae bacterium]